MRQNGITQQILAQYLQKRLNRGSVQQVGQQQAFAAAAASAAGTESPLVLQRNTADNVFAEIEDDGGVAGDTQYNQGSGIHNNNTPYKGAPCIYKYIKIKKIRIIIISITLISYTRVIIYNVNRARYCRRNRCKWAREIA